MGVESEEQAITPTMIREALSQLYSPGELAKSALAQALPVASRESELLQRARCLRNALLDAVEALRPSSRVAYSASAARAYECLALRYVSGMSIEEVSEEMSLSQRQVYRDLRWAEVRLAELLSLQASRSAVAGQDGEDPLAKEISHVERRMGEVDLDQAVRAAMATVAPLCQRRGVRLRYRSERRPLVALATPGVLRQFIVQVISAVTQSVSECDVLVRLEGGRPFAVLHLPLDEARAMPSSPLLQAALRIGESQGVGYQFITEGAMPELRLRFPLVKQRLVLVVEDNEGAFALYQRYLEDSEWVPLLAAEAQRAPDLAASEGAEAVVLDIMMPETNGWTVLQLLKHDARSKDIPVIICSVVPDPELGFALGACAYLTKPVSRQALLDTLAKAVGEHKPGSDWPGST